MFSIMRDSVTLFGMVTTPRCICHLQTKWIYNNLSLIKIKHLYNCAVLRYVLKYIIGKHISINILTLEHLHQLTLSLHFDPTFTLCNLVATLRWPTPLAASVAPSVDINLLQRKLMPPAHTLRLK